MILGFFFVFVCFFCFLASWILGFLASWLLGFSASRLLGAFAASGRFSAFRRFMRLLAAFGGFGFSHPSGFWFLHRFIGFWIWLPASSASPPPYI